MLADLRFLLRRLRHLFGGLLHHVVGQFLQRLLHRRVASQFLLQSLEGCRRVLFCGSEHLGEALRLLEGFVEILFDAEFLLHLAQGVARLVGERLPLLDPLELIRQVLQGLGKLSLLARGGLQRLRLLLWLISARRLLQLLPDLLGF